MSEKILSACCPFALCYFLNQHALAKQNYYKRCLDDCANQMMEYKIAGLLREADAAVTERIDYSAMPAPPPNVPATGQAGMIMLTTEQFNALLNQRQQQISSPQNQIPPVAIQYQMQASNAPSMIPQAISQQHGLSGERPG